MEDSESSDDDPFNERVTQKLDNQAEASEKTNAMLDQLCSTPQGTGKVQQQQLEMSGQTDLQSTGPQTTSKTVTTMIDTTETKAFELQPEKSVSKRIDLSNLIDDGSDRKKPLPLMKKVSIVGLAGLKRTYNVYTQGSALCCTHTANSTTSKARPFPGTLSNLSEKMKMKRFKRYTPSDLEYADYEPWEFKKQMKLEIIKIKVNEASYKEQNGRIVPKHYRTVTKEQDLEGFFEVLNGELEEMARQYGKTFDEVTEIFESVNCDKKATRDRLAGQHTACWKKGEDLVLRQYHEETMRNGGIPPKNQKHYECLLEEKGLGEINKRMKIIGLKE